MYINLLFFFFKFYTLCLNKLNKRVLINKHLNLMEKKNIIKENNKREVKKKKSKNKKNTHIPAILEKKKIINTCSV